jgi:hypothetical protein
MMEQEDIEAFIAFIKKYAVTEPIETKCDHECSICNSEEWA